MTGKFLRTGSSAVCKLPRPIARLALQLRFLFDVGLSCDGLVSAAPHRPGDDVSGPDAALGQAHRHTPDLLHGPADQSAACQALAFLGGAACLSRRIARQDTLKRQIESWEEKRNAARPQIKWQFTTQDARIKLRSLYPSAHA